MSGHYNIPRKHFYSNHTLHVVETVVFVIFSVPRLEGKVNLMTLCFHPSREPTLLWEGSDISREKLEYRWYKNLANSRWVAWFLWQPAFVWRSADLESGIWRLEGFKGTGLGSEIQGNIMCFTRTRRICEDVSRRTCQALDHSFPSLAPSFAFAHYFFLSLSAPQTWGFIFKKSLSRAWFTALWNYEKGKLTLLHKVALGAIHRVDGGGSLWGLQATMPRPRGEAVTCVALTRLVALAVIKALDVHPERKDK